MNIKTKFKVGDLLEKKYDKNPKDTVQVHEVMEVLTQTCYAGTQAFYQCRTMTAEKEYAHQFKKEGDYQWAVMHSVSRTGNDLGWRKYREDEMVEADKEKVKIILGKG